METAPGSHEDEKYCIDVSCFECTGMQYVTCRSHRMQNPKIGVKCPGVLFMETAPGPPEHENSALMFRALNVSECTM
jgi:hypothetical protein